MPQENNHTEKTRFAFVRPPLSVRRTDPRAKLPAKYDDSSIGLDVFAFLLTESGRPTSRAIHMKGTTEIPTGIKVRAPPGYYIEICSKPTLAKRGIFVADSPAIVPQDHDGELVVLLFNGSYETQYVAHEHRIAQLILQPIIDPFVRENGVSPPEHQEDVHPGPRKDNH